MSIPAGYEEVPGSALEPGDQVLMASGQHWEFLRFRSNLGVQDAVWGTPAEKVTKVPATVKRKIRDTAKPDKALTTVGLRPTGAITVQEYLARYGVTGEALRGISGQFGKRVAGGYRARHGDDAAPDQIWEYVQFLGRDHLSNCYGPADQDLLDMVREKFYPQLRIPPIQVTVERQDRPSTVDMFDPEGFDGPIGDGPQGAGGPPDPLDAAEARNPVRPAIRGGLYADGMPEGLEQMVAGMDPDGHCGEAHGHHPHVWSASPHDTRECPGNPYPAAELDNQSPTASGGTASMRYAEAAPPPSKMEAPAEITLENGVVVTEAEYRAGLALTDAGITTEPIPPSAHHPEIKHEKPRWLVQWEMSRCRAAGVPCGHELCREAEARRARQAVTGES